MCTNVVLEDPLSQSFYFPRIIKIANELKNNKNDEAVKKKLEHALYGCLLQTLFFSLSREYDSAFFVRWLQTAYYFSKFRSCNILPLTRPFKHFTLFDSGKEFGVNFIYRIVRKQDSDFWLYAWKCANITYNLKIYNEVVNDEKLKDLLKALINSNVPLPLSLWKSMTKIFTSKEERLLNKFLCNLKTQPTLYECVTTKTIERLVL
ncbi:hypothetical protein ENBRE01_1007 [Enteropsectra breve]|nr:hypothetical protein ENBRE01_1007 [Enteropsectra breve]